MGDLTLREWQDIDADLWEMEKAADPKKKGSGGKEAFTAFAQAIGKQDGT